MSDVRKSNEATGSVDIGPSGTLPEQGANARVTRTEDESLALGSEAIALNAKMHLVNDTIDEIGWVTYHWKLFFLTGYAVDSLILLLQSILTAQAALEFNPPYDEALAISSYAGMFTGAIFWGLGADIIGRRRAFNVSLFICSIFCIISGAAPSWFALALFQALTGFGGGGNLILDTTVFLEYLPSKKQWVLTVLAAWWGIGQTIAGLIAWGFMAPRKWNCISIDTCTRANNQGWRYLLYTCGSIVFVLSVLRVTVIRLRETPKFSLTAGRDEEVVRNLQGMAFKYNRPCSITLAQLESCGHINVSRTDKKRTSISQISAHLRALFSGKKVSYSTILLWMSWSMIGIGYPLYYVFLPTYLNSRGDAFGFVSESETWRNYVLVVFSGTFGPILAGFMVNLKAFGRKYTMVIGALVTMAFFFAYTQIQTKAQNLGIGCSIAFSLRFYYGVLYAYTVEILPSAHRATGDGIAVAFNRLGGMMSAVIAGAVHTSNPTPIYVCSALFGGLAVVAALFPFEPYGKRST